jgi:hypothetical protein
LIFDAEQEEEEDNGILIPCRPQAYLRQVVNAPNDKDDDNDDDENDVGGAGKMDMISQEKQQLQDAEPEQQLQLQLQQQQSVIVRRPTLIIMEVLLQYPRDSTTRDQVVQPSSGGQFGGSTISTTTGRLCCRFGRC